MKLEKSIATLILAALVACPIAYAQQKDPRVNPPVQPLPPLSPGESSTTTATSPEPAAAPAKSEQRPISDIEQLDLSAWIGGRSVLTSSFRVSLNGDTNPSGNAGGSRIDSAATFAGNVNLARNWRNSSFSASYSGGGTIYNTRSSLNRQNQLLGLSYRWNGQRWSLSLQDRMGLLPESSFGFGAGIGSLSLPGLPGALQSQLNPLLVPNQSILTGFERRISNTAAGQVGYVLGRRSSLSFSSSYGFLRGLGSNLIGNDRWSVGTGFSYLVTPRDSVTVSYSHSNSSFVGSNFGFSGDSLNVGYSRQLSARLALQLSAGPNFSRFRNPVTGDRNRVSSTIRTNLQYQLENAGMNLSYTRGITGGSGVLLGAHTDQVEGGISKQLSRMWGASLQLGYAHNASLFESTGLTVQSTFNSWFANVGFSRPIGRHTRMGFTYGLTSQASNVSFCQAAVCGRSAVRHRFGLSFDFNFRPIALE